MSGPRLISVELQDRTGRRSVWLVGVAVALAGHLAFGAFAIARLQDDPDDVELGAPGISISFELTAPQAQPSNLPPGPESEASAASPPAVEQKTVVAEAQLPQETPVEAEQPDRLVALNSTEKPREVEPEVKTAMVKPSEASEAHEATAAPGVVTTVELPVSTTPDPGTAASRLRVRATWQKELLAHLDRFKRYPTERSRANAEIVVALSLDRTGHVVSVNVARSSGDDAFDKAAVAMVEHASPVPSPPPLVADEGLSFMLPVIFRKNGK